MWVHLLHLGVGDGNLKKNHFAAITDDTSVIVTNLCPVKYVVQWRMDNLSLALLAKRPLAVVLAQGFEDGVKLAVDCLAWDF